MNAKATNRRKPAIGLAKLSILLLAASALVAGCTSQAAPNPTPEASSASNRVKVEPVARISMGDPREQIGEVSASVRFDIVTQAGGTMLSLLKGNGDRVRQGDVIARLEDATAALEREKAELGLRSAEQALASSKAELDSSRLQLEANISKLEDQLKELQRAGDEAGADDARRNLDIYKKQLQGLNAKGSIASAQSAVDNARLSLKAAELALQQYEIKSPSDGVLTGVKTDAGAYVSPGAVFGVVQNVARVKVKVKLTEATIELARNKKEMLIATDDGKSPTKARVIRLSDLPDPSTNTYDLELEADNASGALKPGARVRVQLTTPEEETVVAVPSLAVVRDGEETSVFVVSGGKAAKKKVELGRVNGIYQEIRSGLSVGDTLVVSGQHLLKDGQAVEVESK